MMRHFDIAEKNNVKMGSDIYRGFARLCEKILMRDDVYDNILKEGLYFSWFVEEVTWLYHTTDYGRY